MKYLYTLILTCLCCSLWATTYYIKDDGNNSDDGLNWGNAWLTISKLDTGESAFTGGDTVFINGTFIHVGKVRAHYGGTFSDRTAIIAGNGVDNTPTRGGAILIGGDTLQNWSDQGGGVWRCSRGVLTNGGIGGVCIDDSLLFIEEQGSTTPDTARYSHDGTYVYIRLPDSGNPNSHYIMGWDDYDGVGNSHSIFSYHGDDVGDPQGHTTYWGLDVKYFTMFIQQYGQTNIDSITVERCNLRYSSSPNYSNYAQILSACPNSSDTANTPTGWIIRACSLGYCGSVRYGGGDGDRRRIGTSLSFYTFVDLTIDSNVFYGDFGHPYHMTGTPLVATGSGIILIKNQTANTCGPAKGAIIAFNKFDVDICDDAIVPWWNHQTGVLIYGNIIKGAGSAFDLGADGTPIDYPPYASFNKIYNNTIINTIRSYHVGIGEGEMIGWDNEIKYNIFAYTSEKFAHISQQCTTGMMIPGTSLGWMWDASGQDTTHFIIDSNLYYQAVDDTVFLVYYETTCHNLTDWFNRWGWDENSILGVDPGFNDTAAFDYSRPGASGEMDETRDGKKWSLFGAWQPPDSTVERVKLNKLLKF